MIFKTATPTNYITTLQKNRRKKENIHKYSNPNLLWFGPLWWNKAFTCPWEEGIQKLDLNGDGCMREERVGTINEMFL